MTNPIDPNLNPPVGPLEEDDSPPQPLALTQESTTPVDTISGYIPSASLFSTSGFNRDHISISDFVKLLEEVKTRFKNQLAAAATSDRELEKIFRTAILTQLESINEIRQLLVDLYQQGVELTDEINSQIEQINQQVQDFSQGSGDDEDYIQDYNDAVQEYTDARDTLQLAIDSGDPVPQNLIDDYNEAVTNYNTAKNALTTYANTRNPEIQVFINDIGSYNSQVAVNNGNISDYNDQLDSFGIPELSSQEIVTLPQGFGPLPTSNDLPLVEEVMQGNLPEFLPEVEELDLTAYTQTIGSVPTVDMLNESEFTSISLDPVLNPILFTAAFLFEYFRIIDRFDPKDPLLPLRQQLVPDAIILEKYNNFVRTSSSQGSTFGLKNITFESTNTLVEQVFSKALIDEIFKDRRLRLSPKETDRLQLFATSILGFAVQQAIAPGFSVLGTQLLTLEGYQPAFDLTFALSLNSRIQERVNGGEIGSLLDQFIAGSESLKDLPLEEKDALRDLLTNLISGSLLLSGATLLATALGLPSLVDQIIGLTSSVPENVPSTKVTPDEEKKQLTNFYTQKGLGAKETEVLAGAGSKLLEEGVINPFTLPIRPDTIRLDTLKNSIASGLILKGLTADDAVKISKKSVNALFPAKASFTSVFTFRQALDESLRKQKVSSNIALEVSNRAILSGNLPDPLATRKPGEVSLEEIQDVVKTRAKALLGPSIGEKQADELGGKIVSSLVGNQESSPLSTVNLTRDALRLDKEGDEERYSDTRQALFKDKLAVTRDPHTFYLKIMQPAYTYELMHSITFYGGVVGSDLKKAMSSRPV